MKQLLVIDKFVREEDTEKIMDTTENLGGKVMVISSEHEGENSYQLWVVLLLF